MCLDGRPVKRSFGKRPADASFVAYYKPSGSPATRDSGVRTKLGYPAPPKHGRWIAISAPDTNTAGLVVLTTDGRLANRLTRAGDIEQEFAVRLLGKPSLSQLQRLEEGVDLEHGHVLAQSVIPTGGGATNVWFDIAVRGGSRELRTLLDAAGLAVSRIIRIRYGPVKLGTLRRGQSRPLSRTEIDALRTLSTATRTIEDQ